MLHAEVFRFLNVRPVRRVDAGPGAPGVALYGDAQGSPFARQLGLLGGADAPARRAEAARAFLAS